jgi:tetratricopeptide (TPR) repeat protein/predicted Ser/Thr protein kinase
MNAVEPLPAKIGKYQVACRLGAGAMGVVYQCTQAELGRPVAVKVMIAGRHASADQIRRFQREAWAAAQLAHPNVLQIYDIGRDGEVHYLVMEYIDGCPLHQLIGTPELTVERSLRLVRQLARALQATHAQGIIHRDIKPSNILIHRSGQPKLADFGLAKSLGDEQNLSGSGDLIGTPRYMSPEQVLAAPQEVDARTDIYSLGAVLYEMLTGRPPVDGPTVLTILRNLSDAEPTPVRECNPDIPEEVAAVCQRALAKKPDERFASAAEFASAIEAYLAHAYPGSSGDATVIRPSMVPRGPRRPLPARIGWKAGLAACLVLGLSLLTWWLVLGGADKTGLKEHANFSAPAATDPVEEGDGGPEDLIDAAPAKRPAPLVPDSSKIIQMAEAQLSGRALDFAGTDTPREVLKGLVVKLSSVVDSKPSNIKARFLLARAHRLTGEFLPAIKDASEVLRLSPQDAEALTERLLANYQFHVLYLGSLNERVLRPFALPLVQEDVRAVAKLKHSSLSQKRCAELVEALAAHEFIRATHLAESSPRLAARDPLLPDLRLLEADALLHGAEASYAAEQATEDPEQKANHRKKREELALKGSSALQRGIDTNPHHVGLLFLKADTFQRRYVWGDIPDSEDRDAFIRQHRLGFDTALDRLRNAASMSGCENATARAVLLYNYGRNSQALDRIRDALNCTPTVPYLRTLDAWLRLQEPPSADGNLTAEEITRILHDFQPVFDSPQAPFNCYFLRALLQTAAGNWSQAQADLKACRKKLGKDELPATEGAYQVWFNQANAPFTNFLDATAEILWYLRVNEDVRISLSRDVLLPRLNDGQVIKDDKLKPEDVKTLKGRAHFRLAKSFAAKNDRNSVLSQLGETLKLGLPDFTPKTLREDDSFKAWNMDEEFVKLYNQYEKS